MNHFYHAVTVLFLTGAAIGAGELRPLMTQPDQVVLREDFARETAAPDKAVWKARQGTRWSFEDGVLRGRPSTAEYQAKKKDHKGLEPRLSLPGCPPDFAIAFSIRVVDGSPTSIVPFVEFGHHLARVNWTAEGVRLLADHESVELAQGPGFRLVPGQWRRALAEMQGDEFVIQFADGPTLYGRHAAFAGEKDGFGVAGLRDGVIELDDVTVWSLKAKLRDDWSATRAGLPPAKAVELEPAARGKK